jgi:type IV pilus assembly protein PilF
MLLKVRILWLCATCLVFFSACATTPQDGQKPEFSADQLQRMAESYLAAGDTGLALQYLTMAEKMKPDDPLIQYDFGLAYGARGLPAESLAHFQKALALKPDYAEASNALGALYAERGELDKAEAEFGKALANPFYQTPHYAMFNMARVYEKRGNLTAALQKYQQAVGIQPTYAPAYLRMGFIHEQLGQDDAALENYQRTLQFSPNTVEAILRIGLLQYKTGAMDEAYSSFSQVVRLSPNSSFATEARKYLETLPAGDG